MALMTVHGRLSAAALALACLWQAAPLAQRGGSNLFTDPSGRYSIEFPKGWDWTIVEGAGEALSTFVHPKKEAAIVVERFRMEVPLAQNQITEAFAQFETETLKENPGPETGGPDRLHAPGYRGAGQGRGRARAAVLVPDRRQQLPNHDLFAPAAVRQIRGDLPVGRRVAEVRRRARQEVDLVE
jgi:hypothetical protein